MSTSATPILFVDDDADYGRMFVHSMAQHGFSVDHVESPQEASQALGKTHYHMVLVDLFLGDRLGTEAVLPEVFRRYPHLPTLILTSQASVDTAVEAMQRGASGYIQKDAALKDIARQLRVHLEDPHQQMAVEQDAFGMVGRSPAFVRMLSRIHKLVHVDSTVLVQGESGTGKELVARALHLGSARKEHPFRAVNCGAIPDSLLESELFGYRRGAFTDAKSDRKGLFEQCERGTVFLDEIGEMPFPVQVKLLRVLQEREVYPLGAERAVKVNVRVVAATNRNLKDQVKEGDFREDLYYRLSVLPLLVPPLRDRTEDIPLLVEEFLRRFNLCFAQKVAFPPDRLLNRLMAYQWPGNIRELQNVIERGVVLSEAGQLSESVLFEEQDHGEAGQSNELYALPLKPAKKAFERRYLESLLQRSDGNVSEAARIAECNRVDLYRIAKRHNVSLGELKSGS